MWIFFLQSYFRTCVRQAYHRSRLDFDDESSMDDVEYNVLTGFDRHEFNDIVSSLSRSRKKHVWLSY